MVFFEEYFAAHRARVGLVELRVGPALQTSGAKDILACIGPADAGWYVGFGEGFAADVACLYCFEAVGEEVGFCRQIVGGQGGGVEVVLMCDTGGGGDAREVYDGGLKPVGV
jgi:hypothetical protein